MLQTYEYKKPSSVGIDNVYVSSSSFSPPISSHEADQFGLSTF